MIKSFGQNQTEVVNYTEHLFQPEDDLLLQIRKNTVAQSMPQIQVGAFDARHLEILVRLANAKKIVEIGTLGGYSGVALCRGLSADGQLYTFEFSDHHAQVAKQNFALAGVSQQVQIYVGPALEHLPKIQDKGPFDMVFIDADKINYQNYFAWAEKHLRVGGALIADNTFAWNLIHKHESEISPDDKPSVMALKKFNLLCAHSQNFRATILPTGEGLTVAVKIRD